MGLMQDKDRAAVREAFAGLTRPAHLVFFSSAESGEYAAWHMPNAVNIPLPELRARMGEVQAAAAHGPIRLYCMVGFRSYQAYRILHQHGIADVATFSGGAKTFLGLSGTSLATEQSKLPAAHTEDDLAAEALLEH